MRSAMGPVRWRAAGGGASASASASACLLAVAVLLGACGRPPHTPVSREQEVERAYARGLSALEAGRYGDAVRDLRAVLGARPADLEVRYNLGVALLRLRSWKEAAEALSPEVAPSLATRTLAVGVRIPKAADADYLYALGTAYQEQRLLQPALACLEATLLRDAKHLKARYARAVVLEEQGDLERARAAWLDYLQNDESGTWSDSARRHVQAIEARLHPTPGVPER